MKKEKQIEIDRKNEYKICISCGNKMELDRFSYIKGANCFDCKCRKCRSNKIPRLKSKVYLNVAFKQDGELLKNCCSCNKIKSVCSFRKNKTKRDGYNGYCKECYTEKYYPHKTNPLTIPHEENGKIVRLCKCCNTIKEIEKFSKDSRYLYGVTARCQDCSNIYLFKYNKKNLKKRKIIRDKSEKKHRNKRNFRLKEKRINEPEFRLLECIRNTMKTRLKHNRKSNKTMKLIGLTINEYSNYLESLWEIGMNWDNYKINGWTIDHITPCELFDLSNPKHQEACFNYKNTKPMWHRENIIKMDKLKDGRVARSLTREEKDEYLKTHGFDYLFN
jgi:hypothetical protein